MQSNKVVIQGVLVDLDNTLYEYNSCNDYANERTWNFFASKYKISNEKTKELFLIARKNVKIKHAHTAFSHSRQLYFEEMLRLVNHLNNIEVAAKELDDYFWKNYFSKMILYNKVVEFFEVCKRKNIPIVLITDLTSEIQNKKVDYLGIKKYFSGIITSEDIGVEKPDKKMFIAAMEILKTQIPNTLMIGDDVLKDIEGAKSFGMQAFLIKKDSDWAEVLNLIK